MSQAATTHVVEPAETPLTPDSWGKLGMWIFIATEILMFGGLFVAYGIFRNLDDQVFKEAHLYLNKQMGALNTIVLLFSSLTAALSVRSAQLGKRNATSVYLVITILCACAFLVVKYFEYHHKFEDGLLPGHCFGHPWFGDACLTDRIALVGPVNQERLADLYASADVFLLASLYEGYGMVLAEAMARGLPIAGPKVHGVQWTGDNHPRLLMNDFPMDQMPPFAAARFLDDLKSGTADAMKSHHVQGPVTVEIADAASNRVMQSVTVDAAHSTTAGAPTSGRSVTIACTSTRRGPCPR